LGGTTVLNSMGFLAELQHIHEARLGGDMAG
jgi:hypothetical protein